MNDKQPAPGLVAVMDQAIAHALATGLIERVRIDEKGRTVYRATKKTRSASPSSAELN